jgi:hypothetical protein
MAEWLLFTERDWHECQLEQRFQELKPLCWAKTPPRILARPEELQATLARLRERILSAGDRVQFEHGTEGKIPRAHVRRTYRLTDSGAMLAATTLQHSQAFDLCEVDAVLAVDVPEREPLAAVRAIVLLLLTDSVKCGGSMAIQFTKACSGGPVPEAIQQLARQLGVRLESAARGLIAPDEAREIYLQLSGFSAKAQQILHELHLRRLLSIERVCYLVHHGIWSKPEMELLLVGSHYPDLILARSVVPDQRQLHALASWHAMAAVLGGILQRALAYRDPLNEDATTFVPSQDVRNLCITVDAEVLAQVFEIDENLELRGWLVDGGPLQLAAGEHLMAVLRPWTRAKLAHRLLPELEMLKRFVHPGTRVALVVPFEYHSLAEDLRREVETAAQAARILLLVCPEKLAALSNEAERRLELARMVRK